MCCACGKVEPFVDRPSAKLVPYSFVVELTLISSGWVPFVVELTLLLKQRVGSLRGRAHTD